MAVLAVTIDVTCVFLGGQYGVRLAFALITFVGLVILLDGDVNSLGLRLQPAQGWTPWISWSLRIGLVVALLVAAGQVVWTRLGNELPVYVVPPQYASRRAVGSCLMAPVLEETVYRLLVCVPLVTPIGCRWTITISGIMFGLLHILYGNPSPENLFGGFFLAWAFLKSESIVVPVLLHSIGNGIVVASQVAVWYFMHQPA